MAEIEAGPETNALVAERVMGWHLEFGGWVDSDGKSRCLADYWVPTTEIASAWPVVEKMQADGFDFILEFEHADGNGWEAEFFESDELRASTLEQADTAPLAICKAALQAVGYSPVAQETAGT